MGYAVTLKEEIMNQAGYPVKMIISESDILPKTDGSFYSFGDMLIRTELILSIVTMCESGGGCAIPKPTEILHG